MGVNATWQAIYGGTGGVGGTTGPKKPNGGSLSDATTKINELIAKTNEWKSNLETKKKDAENNLYCLEAPTIPCDKDERFYTTDEDGNKIFKSADFDAEMADYRAKLEEYNKQVDEFQQIISECDNELKTIENILDQLYKGLNSAGSISNTDLSVISDMVDKSLTVFSGDETADNSTDYKVDKNETNQIKKQMAEISEKMNGIEAKIDQVERKYVEARAKSDRIKAELNALGSPEEPNPENFVNPETGEFDAEGFDAEVKQYNEKMEKIRELQDEFITTQAEISDFEYELQQLNQEKLKLKNEFEHLQEVLDSEEETDDLITLQEMLSNVELEAQLINQDLLTLFNQKAELEKEYDELKSKRDKEALEPPPSKFDYRTENGIDEEAYNAAMEDWHHRLDKYDGPLAELRAKISELDNASRALDDKLYKLEQKRNDIKAQIDTIKPKKTTDDKPLGIDNGTVSSYVIDALRVFKTFEG